MSRLPRIPIARPDIQNHEREKVKDVMANGWISQGPFVSMAESHLRILADRKHAICVSSGTTALIVALLAIRPKGTRSWEVAAPMLTFAAVHNAIKIAGGYIRYQAPDADSWQVVRDPGFNSDAIVCAPCYGKVEGSDRAGRVGDITQVPVIEDAAESFTGFLSGTPAGKFGLISCISFYANKIVTSGEGGAILTDDTDLYLKMKTIVNHGIAGKDYVSEGYGLNGRMTDLQAAMLCGQFEHLPLMLDRRRQIISAYGSAAAGKWKLPTYPDGGIEQPAPWLFAGIPDNREAVIRQCDGNNIEWRPFFAVPEDITKRGLAPDARSRGLEIGKRLSETGLCLPLSSAMGDWEVERVMEVIRG